MLIKKKGTMGMSIPSNLKVVERAAYIVGIDAGSTQTRVCLADAYDVQTFVTDGKEREALGTLDTVYTIPSTFATVGNEREISPRSNQLEDNYDSHIFLVRGNSERPPFTAMRVIRGSKLQDISGVVPRYMDSSTAKTDNQIFYANIVDAIGYALLQCGVATGAVAKEYDLKVVVSVRPKEMTSKAKKTMTENLLGKFMFTWGTYELMLNIVDLDYTTEPEAQITGNTTMMYAKNNLGMLSTADQQILDKMENSASYMHIEGGGSSIGVELVRDGAIQGACSSTFPLGGNYLVRRIIDVVREATGRTPSEASVQEAVITCLLRNGSNQEDIGEFVYEAKNNVAMDIIERIRHQVVDTTTDLTFSDLEFVSVAGRLFNEDGSGNSIANMLPEYISQVSPNTQLIHLNDNRIPQGNVIIGMENADGTMFFDALENGSVADEEVSHATQYVGSTGEAEEDLTGYEQNKLDHLEPCSSGVEEGPEAEDAVAYYAD